MEDLHSMFSRRVIIVSGKGGVGKSTVTAALASLAASQGKKVLVVELAGQCAMAQLLGGESAGYKEVKRGENLYTLSVTPEQSMEEYLIRELKSKRLYHLIFKNKWIGPFIAAVPGLEDLVSIGKIMDLQRAVDKKGRPVWDIVMVDAPATGQGLNLLRVPKAMMDMTRMGPFYQNTKIIQDMLVDPARTVLNLVTLPEEMPVNETVEMHKLVKTEIGIAQGYLIVNCLRPRLFDSNEQSVLREMIARGPASNATHALAIGGVLRTAKEVNRRVLLQRAYVTRLSATVSLPRIGLPTLPRRNVGPEDIELLAEHLSRGMAARELPREAS